ncbi:MAG: DEAD/DEAH box helicase family protein [Lachnospiraceae bacterium]|nr:DEAD/DEAH box helicase family protein [Lachnospiraceae bacterium]
MIADYNNIKTEYRSRIDDVIRDFFIPLLSEAISYKRAVGFFSSSSLIELSKGICTLAEKGGNIQIVASPYLSKEDVDAIKLGYDERDKVIERALVREIEEPVSEPFAAARLNLLANLISNGILDIRIAYTEDDHGMGMYHEKMGIIEDAEGNTVAFSGSMNESYTAMAVNYETIDVFCSWKGDDDLDRVNLKLAAFDKIWNNRDKNVEVKEFPNVTKLFVQKYKKIAPDYELDNLQFLDDSMGRVSLYYTELSDFNKGLELNKNVRYGARQPDDIILYDYQEEAIENWSNNDFCGIFNMATGTGKTLTGLGAISRLSEFVKDEIAVVIVCPYQHLVDQWVEDVVKFNIKPIIAYSSSYQKDWKKRLIKSVKDQKLRKDKKFFCVVCTNATFASDFVQEQIEKISTPILLVVDEAHNFGAQTYSKLLNERFKYRLALSATLERHRDEEGTEALKSFFGKECINYDLEKAIKEEKLTRYRYYPVLCFLNDKELLEYDRISLEMQNCLTTDKNGNVKLNSYGEMLAIQRARIVSGAEDKLEVLKKVIRPYKDKNNILVYCGTSNVEYSEEDGTDDPEEMRQIEAVTRILGNELNMRVARFTSQENAEERSLLKENFAKGKNLQALIAIKCLDEGVNIPGIRTAFILASTTNPKEYIQRRGRVLRKASGKEFAEIYDFITLPRHLEEVSGLTEEQVKRDLSLVKNELSRMEEFARLAENAIEASELIWTVKETYNLEVGI